MRFADQVAIVTGAASGLGRAVSLRLASEGAAVFGVDLNESGLVETESLVTESGGRFTYALGDLSDRMTAHGLVAQCVDTTGRLDVLINCAGVLRANHVTDVTEEEWELIFKVNVAGTLWMCQAAIPHLLESRGNIVNIATNSALMGTAYTAVYGSSKGAVVALTRAMAMEFAKKRIRINAVAPGGINTPMVASPKFPDDADWKLIEPYMGFRRMSEPEEIAAAVAFVASRDAAALHGAIVSADTGLTAG